MANAQVISLPRSARSGLVLLLALALLAAATAGPPAGSAVGAEPETFAPPPFPLVGGTDEQILTVAFSPDGKRLATAGARPAKPGQIKFWDVATRKELVTVPKVPGVRIAVFSPDGDTLATGDVTGTIRLRDGRTGQERLAVKRHEIGVNGLAYSPDGATLASAGLDHTVKLCDAKTLEERTVLRGHTDMVFSVAFFHDGRSVVTCGREKEARVWDVATGTEKFALRGHQQGIEMVAVSPDDRLVATAGWDGTVRLWDAQTGAEAAVLSTKNAAFAVTFAPDGKLVAAATADGTIYLWDVATRKPAGTLGKHTNVIWALAFSPDGSTLASGSADKTAKLWDVAARKEVATLTAGTSPDGRILALAASPDGKDLALAAGNQARLYDARTGAVRHVLEGHTAPVTCLAFAPDGKTLATGSLDQTIRLWDRASGKVKLTLKGGTAQVLAVAFSPDGRRLAGAGNDPLIRLWDPASGKALATLAGHEGTIPALAFAPDGQGLASGGADQTVKVWDLASGTARLTLRGHTGPVRAVAYGADPHVLASAGDDGTIKLWDLPAGKERRTLTGHAEGVLALAFTPSGRTLVSGGQEAAVMLWDPDGGTLRQTLVGHRAPVTALAVDPRGKELFSGGWDQTVLRWRAPAGAPQPLTLQGDPAGNRFVAFSPAGDRMASGGAGGSVILWARSLAAAQNPDDHRAGSYADAAFSPDGYTLALATNAGVQVCDASTGLVRRLLPLGQETRSVAFSPDGRYLAVGTGGWDQAADPAEVHVFEAGTGRTLAHFARDGTTYRVQFSPDGKTLAAAVQDTTVRLYDVPSWAPRAPLRGHTGPVKAMAFLPDGALATAAFDGTIRFWDVRAGTETRTWKTGMKQKSLAVSPDGTLLASADGAWESKGPGRLRVWDIATGKLVFTPRGHDGRIMAVAFIRDGRGLLAVGGRAGEFAEINYWELPTGRLRATQHIAGSWMENVAQSTDGSRVVTASAASLDFWDLNLVRQERTWVAHAGGVSCGLFLENGRLLATGGRDGVVKLWDAAKGERVATLAGHQGEVRSLALLPDGKTLVSAGEDKTVRLWDLATAREKAALRGHASGVHCLAVSPDGKTLASGSGGANKGEPGELILWDLETKTQRTRVPGIDKLVGGLAYSPDGAFLAVGSAPGEIKVRDARTQQLRSTLPAPRGIPVQFSPDGKLLLGGQEGATQAGPSPSRVYLWDTATWKRRTVLEGHTSTVLFGSFSPGGDTLATGGRDGSIQLWRIPRGGAAAVVGTAMLPISEGIEKKTPEAATTDASPATPPGRAAALDPPEPAAKKADRKLWLVGVEVLALLLTLAVLGMWLYKRQARDTRTVTPRAAVAGTSGKRAAAVQLLSLSCPGCEKGLRARVGLAGKRVKCPHCGRAVLVPGAKAGDSA